MAVLNALLETTRPLNILPLTFRLPCQGHLSLSQTPFGALAANPISFFIFFMNYTIHFCCNLPFLDLFLYPVLWSCNQLITININIFIIQPETKSTASLENALVLYHKCFQGFIRHATFDPNL